MPLSSDNTVPQSRGWSVTAPVPAALCICSVNLDTNCNFQVEQKYKNYLTEWKTPAPKSCRNRDKPITEATVLYSDRLGVEL